MTGEEAWIVHCYV